MIIDKVASPLINGATNLASGIVGLIGARKQREFETVEAEKQRLWNEQQTEKANQFSLEMWNKTNEYNSPAAQRQRLIEAGLNPLYYGLDGSSANGFESAQPLGYERASASAFQNPLQAGMNTMLQKAQIDLAKAQAAKTKAETDATQLDNEFNSRTMAARQEGVELANQVSKENLAKIADERKQISANIKKISAETENEYMKKALIEAETNVQKMNAQQIVELLPYNKLFIEAQTQNQKASAALGFANAAIQKGLLDKGFVDATIDKLDAEIAKLRIDTKNAEDIEQINAFKAGVRNGSWSQTIGIRQETKVGKAIGKVLDGIYGSLSALSEAVAGPISGFVK